MEKKPNTITLSPDSYERLRHQARRLAPECPQMREYYTRRFILDDELRARTLGASKGSKGQGMER